MKNKPGKRDYCDFRVTCNGEVLYDGTDWSKATSVEEWAPSCRIYGYEGDGDWTMLRRNSEVCEPEIDLHMVG